MFRFAAVAVLIKTRVVFRVNDPLLGTSAALEGLQFFDNSIVELQADDTDGARDYGAAAPGDRLISGARLLPGQSASSTNRRYRLLLQTDGNLVLYDDVERTAPWSTNTAGINAGHVIMQTDGNLVLYDALVRDHWSSGSPGNPSADLSVQNDGNVVIYRPDGRVGVGPLPRVISLARPPNSARGVAV